MQCTFDSELACLFSSVVYYMYSMSVMISLCYDHNKNNSQMLDEVFSKPAGTRGHGEIGVTIRFYFWNFNIICKGSIQNVVKMKYE